ncbi:FAD-dependent oxidoreductase [Streptosporangium sp. NPDC051022]|uniref:FAD-dependent oxidoreductase n=1 Tax=Streptosporangium sp. NPDC051022 TaxID=3155752 RepID=UPI0034215CE8
MTDVLIVGAGPTGLTLACDLARRGVAVRIIDRAPGSTAGSRAKGPNPRSLEILADLGVVEAILASGVAPLPMRKYRDGRPITDTDPHEGSVPAPGAPYDRGWLIPQWRVEEILRDRLAEYGVGVETGTELTGFEQDGDGVVATLAGGGHVAASYLVGCDGGHSGVRKALGLSFDGETDRTQVMVCGDVEADGLDRGYWHQWFDEDGGVLLCPMPGTSSWQFQATPERDAGGGLVEPSLESFQRLFDRYTRVPGVRLANATWLSTYRVNVRMVDRYRVGRVLLAGDAAHVHPIAGGLGMSTGIQDAFNLGWKLALVVTGQAGAGLLDTYEEERLPVAAWTLDITSDRLRAAMEAIREPGGGLDVVVTRETTNLDLGYRWSSLSRQPDGYDGRLRAGDRAPDAPCRDARTGAPVRLFEVFAGPHFTLLGFGADTAGALREVAAARGDAVRACPVGAGPEGLLDDRGHARSAYGTTGALVLVRPDGHVGLIAPAGDSRAVLGYLDGLGR